MNKTIKTGIVAGLAALSTVAGASATNLVVDDFNTGRVNLVAPAPTAADTLVNSQETGLGGVIGGDRYTELFVESCFNGGTQCGQLKINDTVPELLDGFLSQTLNGDFRAMLLYDGRFEIPDVRDYSGILFSSPAGFDLEAVNKLNLDVELFTDASGWTNLGNPTIGSDTLAYSLAGLTDAQAMNVNKIRITAQNNNGPANGIDFTLDQITFESKEISEPSMALALLVVGGIGLCFIPRKATSKK